jgi:hypothetical protein
VEYKRFVDVCNEGWSQKTQVLIVLFWSTISHDVLGFGNVKSLFGTAPGLWNTLLGVMAQLPSSLLSNEKIMTQLADFSLPIVRVVDVTSHKDPTLCATAIYAHENLEPCVGECVVAFCSAILSNRVPAGVWFPEEAIAGGADAVAVLSLASVGAHTKIVNGSSTVNMSMDDVWGRPSIIAASTAKSVTKTAVP